jgi:hypothetical protein
MSYYALTLSSGSGTVTSVSWTGGIVSIATATSTPAFTIAGTSGGIVYFDSATTWASSGVLTNNALIKGGGAGGAPSSVTTGTGVLTALGVNTGSAGAFVVNGGDLGTPSAGVVTNLTGTASININGTVGATTPAAGTFTTATARAAATQDSVILQGRAGGTSSYSATITPTTLTASRTLTIPDATGTILQSGTAVTIAQGGTGQTTASAAFDALAPSQTGNSGKYLTTNGTTTSWGTVSGGSAATPTALGTVYGATGSGTPFTTALGYQAAASTNGTNTVAIGYQAAFSNTSSSQNTAVGYQAAYNVTGGTNDAFGYLALYGTAASTGAFNSAIGQQALYSLTSGNQNVAVGRSALYTTSSGQYNVAVGVQALYSNTTASNNTAVGYQAGYGLTTGSNNTYLGYLATQSGVAVTGEIVLCTGSTTGKGSNTGYINTSGGVYQGNNSAAWSVTSDQRLKKNIVDNNVGLDAINAVQVRNFEYRLPEEIDSELESHCAIAKEGTQLGVIAQELQAVLPDCVKQESTGVFSVDSDPLTWYMVNAIKQLSAALDAANARIAALETK